MDLSQYVNQLREDLSSAASAGDDQTRQVAAALSAAIEPAARLALMNALSDLAAEVTTHLDGQVVDVRLDGRDVRVVVSGSPSDPDPEPERSAPPPPPGDGGDISRITLRMLDEIKSQAEEAASVQGVSLNTWVAQAVQGALHGGRPRGPWDAKGYGGSKWGPQGGTPGAGRARSRPDRPDSSSSRVRGWVQG